MSDFIELSGIIIKVMPAGEYDKRITIITKERGKISAFARGARRQGNALMGVTRVFASGKFKLREGRDAYSLISANIDNYFDAVAGDMEKTCYGMYFIELADYFAREQMSEPKMLKLLYYALLALTRPALPLQLTRRVFELKLMVVDGEYESQPIGEANDTCRYTWEYIVKSPIEKLFNFVLTEEVLKQLGENIDKSMARHIDKKMNSLEILEGLDI